MDADTLLVLRLTAQQQLVDSDAKNGMRSTPPLFPLHVYI